MQDVLLKNLVNSYLTDQAAHSSTKRRVELFKASQNGATNTETVETNAFLEARKEAFNGYVVDEGIKVTGLKEKCKDYYNRFRDEINESSIRELYDHLKNYFDSETDTIIKSLNRSPSNTGTQNLNVYKASVKSFLDSITHENLKELFQELNLLLKEEIKRRKVDAQREAEKNNAIERAKRSERLTQIIAITAIIANLLGIILNAWTSAKKTAVEIKPLTIQDTVVIKTTLDSTRIIDVLKKTGSIDSIRTMKVLNTKK